MNQKELKELIEFLIEKDIAEFELERGDVKVRIKRAGEHTFAHSQGEARFFAVPAAPAAAPELGRARSGCARRDICAGCACSRRRTSHGEVSDCGDVL